MPRRRTDPDWYKDAIVYETHVRAFFDRNNDGIGDFPGLIEKLDYLVDLGVTAVPAMLLALLNRWLPAALLLAVAGPPLFLFLMARS